MDFVNSKIFIFIFKKMKDFFLLDFFILSVMKLQIMGPPNFLNMSSKSTRRKKSTTIFLKIVTLDMANIVKSIFHYVLIFSVYFFSKLEYMFQFFNSYF